MKTATIVVLFAIGIPVAIAIAFNFDSLFGVRELSGPIAIIDQRDVERGYIGISFGLLSGEDATRLGIETGVAVTEVIPGSSADAAGISRGDVIVQINENVVANLEEFSALAADWKPHETVSLHVFREGKAMPVDVELMTFDAMRKLAQQRPVSPKER